MKTKIFSAFFILFLCLAAVGAVNASADTYGDLTYEVSGNTITITDCEVWATDVVIPSEIDGKAVTGIRNTAFYNCRSLTSVTIPDSVTNIGASAFEGCNGLTSITIPDSVTNIGCNAFELCENIYSVNITDLAAWCRITFGNNSSNPLNNLRTYRGYLYLNGELVENLVIPDSVTNIGNYAFYGCESLKSITIPDSVTSIGDYAFSGCSLTSVTIPDSVTSIGDYAFNVYSLTSVTIPDSVTSIGEGAFDGCSLTSVTIPDSVMSIGRYAFRHCRKLNKVTMGSGVTIIAYYAFGECENIERVDITDIAAWCDIDFGSYSNPLSYSHNLYLNGELVENLVIPDGVTYISSEAFLDCKSLKSITIPESLTHISKSAFNGCYDITSITFQDGSKVIPKSAFSGFGRLQAITIPASMEIIYEDAFRYCKNIKYIFFKGGRDCWDHIMRYSGNEALDNAEIICDAKEKTYKFVTNCETSLPDMISYYIEKAPEIKKNNRSFAGWYDNPQLSGEPVKFPYYSDKTTLYAAWKNKNETATSTSISNNGKNIRVVPTDVETATKITVALYNGDKFVGTKVATYRGGAIEFTTNTEYTRIKVMAWNADNLTPCAKAEVVER